MSCPTFERWLAAGRPEDAAAEARRHASACPSCARALSAAVEVEQALRTPPTASAPDGFADRVLARVAAERRPARSHRVRRLRPALPWWFDAATHPLVAGATILAGLLIWFRGEVGRLTSELATILTEPATGPLAEQLSRPEAVVAITLALLPLAWMTAHTCRRATERLLRAQTRPLPRPAPGSGPREGRSRDPARR